MTSLAPSHTPSTFFKSMAGPSTMDIMLGDEPYNGHTEFNKIGPIKRIQFQECVMIDDHCSSPSDELCRSRSRLAFVCSQVQS